MYQLKSVKIALGVVTLLPFVFIIGSFMYLFFETVRILFSDTPLNPFMYLAYLGYVVPVFAGYSIFYLFLGILYLIHIIQNDVLDNEKTILWIVIIIVLNGLAMPFYWYYHIWKDPADGKVNLNY